MMELADSFGILIIIASILFLLNTEALDDIICEDHYYFFPSHVYKRTRLNVFGVVFYSLFLFVINFGYCIIMLVNWLCHVGRKKS